MKDKSHRDKSKLMKRNGSLLHSRLLTFVEMEGFTNDWRHASLTDDDLHELQIEILSEPTAAPVVPGTGGLRKLRFSPSRFHRGKRGGFRVCYVHFSDFGMVLLVILYDKTKQDDLTPQHKKAIRQLISNVHHYLSTRHYRLIPPGEKGPTA